MALLNLFCNFERIKEFDLNIYLTYEKENTRWSLRKQKGIIPLR